MANNNAPKSNAKYSADYLKKRQAAAASSSNNARYTYRSEKEQKYLAAAATKLQEKSRTTKKSNKLYEDTQEMARDINQRLEDYAKNGTDKSSASSLQSDIYKYERNLKNLKYAGFDVEDGLKSIDQLRKAATNISKSSPDLSFTGTRTTTGDESNPSDGRGAKDFSLKYATDKLMSKYGVEREGSYRDRLQARNEAERQRKFDEEIKPKYDSMSTEDLVKELDSLSDKRRKEKVNPYERKYGSNRDGNLSNADDDKIKEIQQVLDYRRNSMSDEEAFQTSKKLEDAYRNDNSFMSRTADFLNGRDEERNQYKAYQQKGYQSHYSDMADKLSTDIEAGDRYSDADAFRMIAGGGGALGHSEDEVIQARDQLVKKYGQHDVDEMVYAKQSIRQGEGANTMVKEMSDTGNSSFGGLVGTTAATLGTNLVKASDLVPIISDAVRGRPTYENELLMTNITDKTRSNISEELGKKSKFAQVAYNAVTSAADNVINGFMLGAGGLPFMSAQAALSSYNDALAKGKTSDQASREGVLSGVIEAVTEYLPYDTMLGMMGKKGADKIAQSGWEIVKNIAKMAGSEAGEEVTGDIMSEFFDRYLYGDNSEYAQTMQILKDRGYSDEEAYKIWSKDFGAQLLDTALTSALSGALMGGSASIIGKATTMRENKGITDAYKDDAESQRALVDEGLNSSEGSSARSLAEELSGKLDKGKSLSKEDIINQTYFNEDAIREEDTAQVEEAVRNRLSDLGEEDENIVKAVAKTVSGETLTKAEQTSVSNSAEAQTVLDELASPELKGASGSWTNSLNTNRSLSITQNETSENTAEKSARTSPVAVPTNGLKNYVSSQGNVATMSTLSKISSAARDVRSGIENGSVKIATPDSRQNVATGISEIKADGTIVYKTGKDTVADQATVTYATQEQAELMQTAPMLNLSVDDTNSVIAAYGDGGMSVESYMSAVSEAVTYGRVGMPMNSISPSKYARRTLNDTQFKIAYEIGQRMRQADRSKAVEKASAKTTKRGSGKVTFAKGYNQNSTKGEQRTTTVRIAKVMAEATGSNVVIYSSEKVNGKMVYGQDVGIHKKGESAANGFYDPTTDTVYLDINAGSDGEGVVAFTAAHEFTHVIAEKAPKEFFDLVDFLVDNASALGIDVKGLVDIQQQRASNDGRAIDITTAMEEVVADAMQPILTDQSEEVLDTIQKLKTENKPLWNKIVDFLKKFASKLKSLYSKYDPYTAEGRLVRDMGDSIQKTLARLYGEGLVAAGENTAEVKTDAQLDKYGLAETKGVVVSQDIADLVASGEYVTPNSPDKFSPRTLPAWKDSFFKKFGDNAETRRYVASLESFTDMITADDAVREYIPMGSYKYTNRGPLRSNVEYVLTFDMDTSCPRTFQFLNYRNEIQRRVKRPLQYAELVNLLEVMRAYGQQIPCSYCYAENKRVLLSSSYNNFFTFRNNVLNEADSKKAESLMYGYDQKKGTLTKASREVFDRWRQNTDYNPTIEEVWSAANTSRNSILNYLDSLYSDGVIEADESADKLNKIICEHFGVTDKGAVAETRQYATEWSYDTYGENEHTYVTKNDPSVSEVDQDALSLHHEALAYAKSSSSAKSVEEYVPYTDQLNNVDDKTKNYIIGLGGIRKHSTNDFRIDYVQDYMMFFADLAANGWTGHTYTKNAEYAKIFGRTNDRINMSIAMYGNTLDEIRMNEAEGADWEEVKKIRDAYKNVGAMAMVTSDAQLSFALNSDWIDMVIPFHASSLDKRVWYDLRAWFDYTSKQNERFMNSDEQKLALIQKRLTDSGVDFSSEDMNRTFLEKAKEHGAGLPSTESSKIIKSEVTRLKKLAMANGVDVEFLKLSTSEISELYDSEFAIKKLIATEGKNKGKAIKPHFLPGETIVDGCVVPGHNNDIERYKQLCKEYGVHPRFDGVAVEDADGNLINVSDHPNYLKLIKETARTDSAQEPIRFSFDEYDEFLGMTPMEYAMKSLEDFAKIGGYSNLKEDSYGIVNEFVNEYIGKDIGYLSERTQRYKKALAKLQNNVNTPNNVETPNEKLSTRTQEISSADTSIAQIPALFKNKNVKFGKTNIDIGGGRFDLATQYLADRGTDSLIFDPFNRDEKTNRKALDVVMNGGADTATCANVLNVIREEGARDNVILEAAKSIKKDGTAYFMVYEGNGTGVGKKTSKGWQNNRNTESYVPEIEKYFNDVTRKGKLIIAKDPIDNLPQASWQLSENGDTVKYSDRVLMGSLFSGGGTLEAGLVYQMVDKEFAVEYNEKIASVYTDNHGKEHMFVGDVQNFDSKKKNDVFYLHASPVCKNYSPANTKGGENSLDISTAEATARVLEEQMPEAFTVENVKRYKGSEAYNIITDKLDELGYTWDVAVYKASDYGNPTKRERMVIRAVKEGELPERPQKVESKTSWGEATQDLWKSDLIPSNLVKSKIEAIRNTPELKNLTLSKLDKPLMIYDTTKSKKVTFAWGDELAPTLTTKCGDARIIMPDGKVYKPTPKFMGRLQGLPDDYKYPKSETRAFTVIGNGIPTQLTKAVMGGVIDSAYEQTHDGKVLYSGRDSEYLELAKDPEKNAERLQNMVDDFAKEMGYTPWARYHGTPNDFSVFDSSRNGKHTGHYTAQLGTFFSSSEGVAERFSDGTGKVIKAYLADGNYKEFYSSSTQNAMFGGTDSFSLLEYDIVRFARENIDNYKVREGYVDVLNSRNSTDFFEKYPKFDPGLKRTTNRIVKDYVDSLRDEGYIGIKIKNTMTDAWGVQGVKMHNAPSMAIVFDSSNIKSANPVTYDDNGNVIPLSERFNNDNDDIRYSTRDSLGNELSKEQQEFFKDVSDEVKDDDGNLRVFYHGATNGGYTVFDKSYAFVGGNSGAGFYFSSSEDDATENYKDIEGADNYFKWNKLADSIYENGEWQDEPVDDYDEAVRLAKEFYNTNPMLYKVYLDVKNPYIRNGVKSTNLYDTIMADYDDTAIVREDYDNDDDYEEALWDDRTQHFADTIWNAVRMAVMDLEDRYEVVGNFFAGDISDKLVQDSLEWENLDMNYIIENLGLDADVSVIFGDDVADASPELARSIIEHLGFDAIVDKEVGRKFNQVKKINNQHALKGMEGVDRHVIVFNSNQIKNIDNKKPTSNPDIRYSGRGLQVSKQEYAAILKRVGDYQKGDYYPSSSKGELMIPYGGNLYYISGTYTNPYISQVINIDVAEKREIESTNHDAIQEVITQYENNGILLLQGRSLEDTCKYIELVGSDVLQTPIRIDVYDSYDRTGFRKLKPTRTNHIWSETGRSLRDGLERSIDRETTDSGMGESEDVLMSSRTDTLASRRELLTNALESTAQNDTERSLLKNYKRKVKELDKVKNSLADIENQIQTIQGLGGNVKNEVTKLKNQKNILEKRIENADKKLLDMESMDAMKSLLNRERQAAYQAAAEKVDRYKERLKKQAADNRQRTAEKLSKQSEHYQERLKKQTEYYHGKLEDQAQRYRDMAHNKIEKRDWNILKNKILKEANSLNELLLNETKEKHVPAEMKSAVAGILSLFNMDTVGAERKLYGYTDENGVQHKGLMQEIEEATNPAVKEALMEKADRLQKRDWKMRDKLDALREAYAKMTDPNSDFGYESDPVISSMIEYAQEELKDVALADMSMTQLGIVHDLLKMVHKSIRNANRLFIANRQARVSDFGERVISEVRQVGGERQRVLAFTNMIRKLGWSNLKPIYAFRAIGSDTLTELYQNVRKGEDTWAVDVTDARDFARNMQKKYGIKNWDMDEMHDFDAANGATISLTLPQMMSIYAYMKREQAIGHLTGGGVVLENAITKEKKGLIKVSYERVAAKAVPLTVQTLNDISKALTPEQKEYVNEMQRYLTAMGEKGNEVSNELYGIDIFKEKNYFPLKSAPDYMAEYRAEKNKNESANKIKNKGFTKQLVKNANNPVVLQNFMDVWASHVNEMSMYHAFTLPLEDFNKVFNYQSREETESGALQMSGVRPAIETAYTKEANNYIRQMLKDINGGVTQGTGAEFTNKMISLFKKGAVFASASVVIQQPSAIARAAALVDTKYFTKTFTKSWNPKTHNAMWEECKKYAPVAIIKEMGYFDTNMGRSAVDWINTTEYEGISEKAKALVKDGGFRDEFLSKLPSLADEVTWTHIWNAVKAEVQDETGLEGEELLRKSGERFTEVITLTQVYDSTLSRSNLMRSKDTGVKMATSFMAEPTTSLNMMADAVLQGKRQKSAKVTARWVGAVVAQSILNSVLVSLVYASRDDDDKKSWLEKYIASLTGQTFDSLNVLSMIPYVRDIVSVAQGYDVERADMSVISDLKKAFDKASDSSLSPYARIEKAAGAIANIFGLPLKNILRDGRAIFNIANGVMNGPKTSKYGIMESLHDNLPFAEQTTNKSRLLDAYIDGDLIAINRAVGYFKDESTANTQLVYEITDRYQSGEIDEETAIRYLEDFRGYDEYEIEKWQYKMENGTTDGYSKYNDFFSAVDTGKDLRAVIKSYNENGIESSTLSGQITSYYKPMYLEMSTSERAALKGRLLNAYQALGYDRNKKSKDIDKWLK